MARVFSKTTLSKDNHGLSVGLGTWIDKQVSISTSTDELARRLKEPFKIKTRWDQFEEYVLMDENAIDLTIHEANQ